MIETPHHAPAALEAALAALTYAESIADSLKVSELTYRRLFEAARDGIFLLDSDTGKITDANPFIAELLGYSREELLGKELWEIGLLQDKKSAQKTFRQLKNDGYIRYENLPLQNCRGERREVEFISNIYRENGQAVIQCNIRDITTRKGQETTLAAAHARTNDILESITDAFYALDHQWRFTYLNFRAERLLNRTSEELLGKNIWEEFPQAVGTRPNLLYRRAVEEGDPVSFEEFYTPLSTWFEVRAYPSVDGLSVFFQDVSARKEAERAIEESEERLRLATEGAGIGVWQVIVPTREIVFSPRCYEIFGLPADGSVPINYDLVWSVMHPEDVGRVQAALIKSQQDVCDFDEEYRIITADGQLRWIQSRGKPNVDRTGSTALIQGVLNDITEPKRVTMELAAAAARNERIAETLQRSMLQASPSGKFAGIAVETLYQAALNEANVGGDFFDAFALDGNKVALVVGDVSGKGLMAAGRTAEVKYALRAFLHAYQSPEIALAHLNDFICKTHHLDKDNSETFIILALAVIDTSAGEAAFSTAGAEPPLILRSNGIAERIEIIGMPLGIQPDMSYLLRTTPLGIDETVLMATDGITEARRGHAFLGVEGLAEQAGPSASLVTLSQAIYSGARDFASGNLHDDACLLLARRQ